MKALKYIFIATGILMSFKLFSISDYNLHFSAINTKDGLSQNTVRAILEDKTGFIWAGTLDGLNRYDGYNILTYKPKLRDPNSLLDHRIRALYQDKNGFLWIKTYENKFHCFDPIANAFVSYHQPHADNDDVYYTNWYMAKNGDVWLWGNTNGTLRVSKKNNGFIATPFLTEEVNRNNRNRLFLFEDSQGAIWQGGKKGLNRIIGHEVETYYTDEFYFTKTTEINNKVVFVTEEGVVLGYDLKRKEFRKLFEDKQYLLTNIAKYDNDNVLITTLTNEILLLNVLTGAITIPEWTADKDLRYGRIEILLDKNKGIWIYNHTGKVWYYNQKNKTVKKLELIPTEIINTIDMERYNVHIDNNNLIWITTYGNGLFYYDPDKDALQNYIHQVNLNSPSSNYLLSIDEDRHGVLWIGSEYTGIIKVVKSDLDIRVIRPEEQAEGQNNNIRSIYNDRYNNIWVGTKNGNTFIYNNDFSEKKTIGKKMNAYTFCEDNKNRIWIGTRGNGLYILDAVSYKEIANFTYNKPDTTSLGHNNVFHILRDNKNRIWIATFGGGICLVEESSDGEIKFKRFFHRHGNLHYVRHLYQDTKGFIWAGTIDGIIHFHPEELLGNGKNYKLYQMDIHDKHSLNCNDVKTIFEDIDGVIWIGTTGGGLNKYIPANRNDKEYFVAYTVQDGLLGDIISGIMEDENRNLWISTENGRHYPIKCVSFT